VKKIKRLQASELLKALLISLMLISGYTVVAQDQASEYRVVEPDNTVYLYLDNGLVILELAPFMAPNHVAQFKALVAEGFYDGLDLYRVIDGFVVQGGDVSEQRESENKSPLKAEFTRELEDNSAFNLVQTPEFLAEQTGFLYGFPAARSLTDKQEWLVHCPGALAMARNNDADSGTTDFYIVIGQAPRHLDRNMSVFGQVVYGMQHTQAALRGERSVGGGVIEDPSKRTKIVKALMAKEVPGNERMLVKMQIVDSESFANRLHSARKLDNPFFHYKGTGNLDVCYYRPEIVVEPEIAKK
jgi:peptidylprolyl isomerase